MRYGIFSDIHSNLEALETVIDHFKKQRVDGYICLGDLVGYGPNPNEVVETIRSLPNLKIVAGNHDRGAVDRKEMGWFNEFARAALVWTKKELSDSNKSFLDSLPDMVEEAHFTLAHGSPRDPIDEYLLGGKQVRENMDYFTFTPCFVGHSHMPIYFTVNADHTITIRELSQTDRLKITPDVVVVNVGSVGQPRDGDPRASCGVLDTSSKTLHHKRLEYPLEETQAKMRKEKLPRYLSERLAFGK